MQQKYDMYDMATVYNPTEFGQHLNLAMTLQQNTC